MLEGWVLQYMSWWYFQISLSLTSIGVCRSIFSNKIVFLPDTMQQNIRGNNFFAQKLNRAIASSKALQVFADCRCSSQWREGGAMLQMVVSTRRRTPGHSTGPDLCQTKPAASQTGCPQSWYNKPKIPTKVTQFQHLWSCQIICKADSAHDMAMVKVTKQSSSRFESGQLWRYIDSDSLHCEGKEENQIEERWPCQ